MAESLLMPLLSGEYAVSGLEPETVADAVLLQPGQEKIA